MLHDRTLEDASPEAGAVQRGDLVYIGIYSNTANATHLFLGYKDPGPCRTVVISVTSNSSRRGLVTLRFGDSTAKVDED